MNNMKVRKRAFALFLTLSIVWMAVIFGFSSKNADESTEQSNSVTEFLMMLFEENYDSLTEIEKQVLIEKYDGIIRTFAHFCVFVVLGVLTYYTVGSLSMIPEHMIRPAFASLPFCVLFSVTDEYHQSFVPGRSCQLSDVITDTCGAFCGTVVGILIVILVKYIFETKAKHSTKEQI